MRIYSKAETEKATEINHAHELTIQEVLGHRFITIDNFLKDPSEFTALLDTFPAYSNDDYRIKGCPGWKQEIPRVFMSNITEYLSSMFDVGQNTLDISWSTNIYSGRMRSRENNYIPHVDHCPLVFNLWLNEKCQGGTDFWAMGGALTRDESDTELREYYQYLRSMSVLEDWKVFDGDENFQKVFTAEMKYNRMVIYDGNMWHSPHIESDWYIDSFRYSLIGFTEDDYGQ